MCGAFAVAYFYYSAVVFAVLNVYYGANGEVCELANAGFFGIKIYAYGVSPFGFEKLNKSVFVEFIAVYPLREWLVGIWQGVSVGKYVLNEAFYFGACVLE